MLMLKLFLKMSVYFIDIPCIIKFEKTYNNSPTFSFILFKVIYNGNYHWIAISTFGCKKGEIILLDSLFRKNLTLHTKRQICKIMCSSSTSIIVKSMPVQQQNGGVDCGLFAIAVLEHLARTNEYPTAVWFNQPQMRNHALRCLKDDEIYPFPQTKQSPNGKRAVEKRSA